MLKQYQFILLFIILLLTVGCSKNKKLETETFSDNKNTMQNTDLINEYLTLTNNHEWEKALPVINKIVEANPQIQTSWFNKGVCLDELSRHSEAAESFIKAYKIDSNDYGAQYRIFRSLLLANEESRFGNFLKVELKKTPEILENLLEDKDFKNFLRKPSITRVIEEFKSGK